MRTTRHSSVNRAKRTMREMVSQGFKLVAYGFEGGQLALTWR